MDQPYRNVICKEAEIVAHMVLEDLDENSEDESERHYCTVKRTMAELEGHQCRTFLCCLNDSDCARILKDIPPLELAQIVANLVKYGLLSKPKTERELVDCLIFILATEIIKDLFEYPHKEYDSIDLEEVFNKISTKETDLLKNANDKWVFWSHGTVKTVVEQP